MSPNIMFVAIHYYSPDQCNANEEKKNKKKNLFYNVNREIFVKVVLQQQHKLEKILKNFLNEFPTHAPCGKER